MSIINLFDFLGQDTRVRKYLMPVAVTKVYGTVRNAEKLLVPKPLQIGLSEPEVTELENGESGEKASVILDFGCEIHGGVRILAAFNKGVKNPLVKITFGESLCEVNSEIGQRGACNDHAARQFTVPVPALSDQEWGQTGFRFVKLELQDFSTVLKLKLVAAVFIYRDYEYKGSFECSDPEINKIYETAAYTCHLCLQNMVWDGIKRDRLVWIGDMMIETMTVRDIFGRADIVEQSLEFVRDQTPLPGWMNNMPAYSLWWVLILNDWYMATGNMEFLRRQREYLNGLLDMLCGHVKDDGSDTIGSYFLDWPTNADEHKVAAVRSLLKMALIAGAGLCEELGDSNLSVRCRRSAEALELKPCDSGEIKQIAAVMALAGDMDADTAADIIENNGIKDFSTFMGYHLLAALGTAGRYGSAITLMKQYYGQLFKKGATSFWEDYDSSWSDGSGDITHEPTSDEKDIHGDFGAYCYQGFRHSFCHGWAAGPVPYLTEYVLGISITEPGCRTLKITPHLDGLTWAKGTFPTPYGVVSVEHKLTKDGTVESKIDAPDGVKVTLG